MRITILFALFSLSLNLSAQQYSKVRIQLDQNHKLMDLAKLGLEVDHGEYAPHKHFINVFSDKEIAQIKSAGFQMKILIADMEAYVVAQNLSPEPESNDHCDEAAPLYDYETPENYTFGTMGGYYTYQEMLDILDDMVSKYPDLISARAPVGNILTHDGNPIYWLRVSDNPNVDEDEPEVLYTALHHAREPNSLSQMIFFLWSILEQYDSNPEIQYLLNNTELYFMPCLNPDGYLYNELTNPDGGGFWRKNRRDNFDGTFGVDLNRNYGFEWGFDDQGSSPVTDAQTYRGPAPFSEPETQAVRDFCNAHKFQIALNYHTYGNLLIYPWGYLDTPTDEHDTFGAFAEIMTRENNYVFGTGTETVGYTVNGDSDDWFYGEAVTKPPIYAMTPEVGPAFWPSQAQIDEFNKSTYLLNITTAHLVHNYGLAKDLSPELITQTQGEIEFSLKKYGLKVGALSIYLEPVSDNIAWVGSPLNYGLASYEEVENSLPYVLDSDIENNDEVIFNLVVDNGVFTHKQEIIKIYTDGTNSGTTEIFNDPADDLANWFDPTEWATTTAYFFSEPSSITDSPFGQYEANTINEIILDNPIQLLDVEAAFLSFWASWNIENDYDYVQVQLSVDGGNFVPLCGKYSNLGVDPFQPLDEPLYDAVQNDWVQEEIDLSEFLELENDPWIQIRIVLYADGGVEADGFYFDDMIISVVPEEISSTTLFHLNDFVYKSHPNPANDYTIIEFSENPAEFSNASLLIFNTLGQQVFESGVSGKQLRVNTSGWEAGVYYYQLQIDEEILEAKRLSVAR